MTDDQLNKITALCNAIPKNVTWQEAFNEQNKADFKQYAQKVLEVWKYEKNDTW